MTIQTGIEMQSPAHKILNYALAGVVLYLSNDILIRIGMSEPILYFPVQAWMFLWTYDTFLAPKPESGTTIIWQQDPSAY